MANEYVNKVTLGNEDLIDLTGDTATAADVAEGKIFHLASGAQAVGTASGGGGDGVSVFYGTCATAAATAAKVVVCEEFTSEHLTAGTVLFVKFTNAQTYNGAPTLNVNSTGAKNIKRVGTTNAARYEWIAGETLCFVYDGSYWMLTDGGIATTTYYGVTKLSSATNSTSTGLAATASAVKAAYDLANVKQDELVSGQNIKTINNESLLGSGNIEIGGGSGGVTVTTTTCTLTVAGWSNNIQTVNVAGVTASNNVLVTYAPASKTAYTAADIYCIAQGAGTLTFACTTTPTAAVTVNVMVIDGGVTVLNTYYVSGDVVSFEITGYEDRMGDVAVLTGDTVEVTVKGLPPARPGHAVSTFTLKVGSTQDASDIASFSGLSSNDDVRSFVMPACDVYLSYVRET